MPKMLHGALLTVHKWVKCVVGQYQQRIDRSNVLWALLAVQRLVKCAIEHCQQCADGYNLLFGTAITAELKSSVIKSTA